MTESHFDLQVYEDLANGQYQQPSTYVAALKNKINPTEELLQQKLQKLLDRRDINEVFPVIFDTELDCFKVTLLGVEGQPFIFGVRFDENEANSDMWQYESAEYCNCNLLEDERIEMCQSPQSLECWTYLELRDPQQHLTIQLALIEALAGECYALRDIASTRYFSGTWLAEMSQTHTPINPEMTYVIHAVVPEDKDNDPENWWLHTHGLLRFGLPELEILKAHTDNIYTYQHLINATALRFFDDASSWQTKEGLTVAYSEEGYVNIQLEPWQKAITSNLVVEKKGFLFKKAQPFSGDIEDRDEIHSEPAMAIFADIDEKIQSLSAYGDTLHNDRHLMKLLPNSETARMSEMAQEKFALLKQCIQTYPPQEEWQYLMKFACHSEQTDETEHMWFNVKSIQDNVISAELINDPFNIPEMRNGEIYDMPLEQMTDWTIYSVPLQSSISPDDAFQLRRYLNRN